MNPKKEDEYKEQMKFLSRLSQSKNNFLSEYVKYDEDSSKKLYLQVLDCIKISVLIEDIDSLKCLSNLINYINSVKKSTTLKTYYNSIDNPILKTGVVILACKHNKIKILEYIFGDDKKVLNNLSVNIGRNVILPTDEDEESHDAFYYALRSNNTELLETLINKWPGRYFKINSEELDEILSKAYEDCKLRNILISDEVKIFIENKLLNLRFFSNKCGETENVKVSLSDVKQRVALVGENINLIKTEYLNIEIDEKFLFVAKFIAQNLFILKRQLKSTYDRLPWEEMEFCLIAFIKSKINKEKLSHLYGSVLNKQKIISHLKNFGNSLEKENCNINNKNKLTKLPSLMRDKCVQNIIIKYPEFNELYEDYKQIRDISSLETIRNYIELAASADANEIEGRLIITRAIQITGEYFKNTLESPKLSDFTSEYLLHSLPNNTKKLIIYLRNSLSHSDSLSDKIDLEMEEDFYGNVQNDLKKLNILITDVLIKHKINRIRRQLENIISSNNINEIREIAINSDNFELCQNLKLNEHQKIEEIISEIDNKIREKTPYEIWVFNEINKIMSSERLKFNVIQTDYTAAIGMLKSINMYGIHYKKLDDNAIKVLKYGANQALEFLTPKMKSEGFKRIAELSTEICRCAIPRMEKLEDICDITRLVFNIIHTVNVEIVSVSWIEEMRTKLNKTANFLTDECKYESKNVLKKDNQFQQKLSTLANILNKNNLNKQLMETFLSYKHNKKLQAAVEMLVLDVMSILENPKNCLTVNQVFLDTNCPLLIGRNLRNHLAHGNQLMDILSSDSSLAVLLNAEKLATKLPIDATKQIDKTIISDPLRLKEKYERNLVTINNQKRMFTALTEGSLQNLIICIQNGADIYARSINLWTALHFSAKGSNLEVVQFVLKQNININDRNIEGHTPLHIAAKYGRTSTVKLFLTQKSISLNDKDNSGKTALHIAAENGWKEIIKVLLKSKAAFKIKDVFNCTPLHYAAENDYKDIFEILCEKELNVDSNQSAGGFTQLHFAAERGSLEVVNFLLQNKAQSNAKTERGVTPLHLASLNGHLEVVKLLILKGANVNAKSLDELTPLYNATERNHEHVVKILLENGANPNLIMIDDFTPLHYAVNNGYQGIAEMLIQNGANIKHKTTEGRTSLHLASENGHESIVYLLIKNKPLIHATDCNGSTALHLCAYYGHARVVTLLMNNGALANAKDINNETPLHVAAANGKTKIVEILTNHQAHINSVNITGSTPLHLSSENGHKEIAKILIKNGAKINACNTCKETPLLLAAEHNQSEVVEILIAEGADINSVDRNNLTAFHKSVRSGNKKNVEFLIGKNCNLNTKCGFGCTPLHLAVISNHKEVVEVLIENGADINSISNYGHTPLYLAVINNYYEVFRTLIEKGVDVNAEEDKLLSLAVFHGYKEIAEWFIKKTKVNMIRYLYTATLRGNRVIVKAILAKGVDINFKFVGTTPLHITALYGFSDLTHILLHSGADSDILDDKNRTAIELAAANDHTKVVKILLRHKKEYINCKGNGNWTLLHIVAQEGNLELAKYLLQEGADPDAKNDFGSKPIHIAAREGNKNILEFLIDNQINSIHDLGSVNCTLLHYAALGGHLDVVKYLIEQKLDVNATGVNLSTPLHYAAEKGSADIVKLLLNNCAKYDVTNIFERKPIEIACNGSVINLLTLTDKLFEAVKKGKHLLVENYIKEGAVINAKNAGNVTPLHYATWKGYEKMVKILLANKANPNIPSKSGCTSLHYATKFSTLSIVKMLLSNGAIYDIKCDSGKIPLDFAVDQSIIDLLKLINQSFKNVQNGNSKIINDLNNIKHIDSIKSIMNARNSQNKTLIVQAIHNDFPKIKQLKEILQEDVANHLAFGTFLLIQEKYQEALNSFQIVLKKREELFGLDNPGTLDIRSEIAKILYKQQKYVAALNVFQDVYQKQKQILGLNNKDTLQTRSSIALVLHRQGKNDEALIIYKEVCQKQIEILGTYNLDVVQTQLHMALILNHQAKYEEALNLNYLVLEKTKRWSGINDPLILTVQNNIALVLNNQGKHDDALKIYRQVYEQRKKILGLNNSDTLRTLHNMIGVLVGQEKYDEALTAYKALYDSQKANLGVNHVDTLNTKFNMGSLLMRQQKFLGAVKIFSDTLEQRKAILGPNHPDILYTLMIIKIINMRYQFEGKQGSSMLQRVLEGIHAAAGNGDIEIIECLLENDFEINSRDSEGRTPLHFAVSSGDINMIEFLLKNDADCTLTSNKGNTPLHIAVSKRYKDIVTLLLEHIKETNGKKLNSFIEAKTTIGGTTALHVAAINDLEEIVKSLLQYGAIYNCTDSSKKTPLELSTNCNIISLLTLINELFKDAKEGNHDILRKIQNIKQDAFLAVTRTRNLQGNTLLVVAIINKRNDIVAKLGPILKTI